MKSMKKTLFLMAVALVAAACTSSDDEVIEIKTKRVKFSIEGDFSMVQSLFNEDTRSTALTDAENTMTDLWIFDFVGDECVQSLHQSVDDDGWGQPSLTLTYGIHHLYFVASRGSDPTVNTTAKTIVWGTPRDTFWKDYAISVDGTTGNQSVELDRVAMKLKVTITDEIPDGTATISLTPSTWFYGINYTTGAPAGSRENVERSVNVPANYIGTSGSLSMSIFGFSSVTEWNTDVDVAVKNAGGDVLGSATISNAPIKRNMVTSYQGRLFTSPESVMMITLNDDWLDERLGTW